MRDVRGAAFLVSLLRLQVLLEVAQSTPSNFGSISASPRSSKSIDFPRSAGLCWILVLGRNPFAMPGTKTLSNSSPFAAWIVMTLTESSADGCTGDHSCLSMRSTVST